MKTPKKTLILCFTLSLSTLFLFWGCNSDTAKTTHKGKRDENNDSICKTDNKLAYTFESNKEAEEANCSQARQHMGKIDPKTGEVENFEAITWCCPK